MLQTIISLKGLPMITLRIFRYCVAACVTTTIAVCLAELAHSQTIDTSQVLCGNSRCDHVVAQVMRHGVNRHATNLAANNLAASHLVGSSPFGLAAIASSDIGDLQIVSVQRVADLQTPCGPRFKIVVMNQSQHPVEGVDVSLVALLGAIQPHSPNATVRSCGIEPGTAVEVDITLPIEALSMGNNNGVVLGLQTLLVAIDSHDEWIEVDEANNLQALAAASIPIVETVITQMTTTVSESEFLPSVAAPAMVAPTSVPAADSLEVTPEVDGDLLRQAVEKLGRDSAEISGDFQ